MESVGFDFYQFGEFLFKMVFAYLLALPMAMEHKHIHTTPGPGLRTFPLVAVGACAFMLIGLEVLHNEEARARIAYGIITGIGFIGGGAILKNEETVRGTASAASIWNTGAIGIAIAWQCYEIAVILSLINYITFVFFSPGRKRKKIDDKRDEIL
ncbi:MAG: MgtC/SapB family protein [bacterium]|jgi:putative Mg2+ transporter-C (MgtC) family protein